MNSGKIGLIAGGGDLPLWIARDRAERSLPTYIIALKGLADTRLDAYEGARFGLGELGRVIKTLKKEQCEAVCFAGLVRRPNFKSLKIDWGGMRRLPHILSAARQGDDALLRSLMHIFEKEGFTYISQKDMAHNLLAGRGVLGAVSPRPEDEEDIEKACLIARAIGRLDIGQGVVVCRGVVLAVEAQEGTNAMLRRLMDLEQHLRGTPEHPFGVLAKMVKPTQDTRIDVPTLGPKTLEKAAEAGLVGLVFEAGKSFLLEREELIRLADDKGLFLMGVESEG